MIPEYYAVVGSVIASCGGLYYLYLTIRGKVRPNKVTWFFWGAFPMIAFAAQLAQGVGDVAWATFAAGAPPLLVVIASFFNPEAYWKLGRTDYIFAAVAVISLVLWQITKNANVALTFALLADMAAAIPTVLKMYAFPETEDWRPFALGAFGFGLAILSVEFWTYENYAFVSYLFAFNLFIVILGLRGPQKRVIDANA